VLVGIALELTELTAHVLLDARFSYFDGSYYVAQTSLDTDSILGCQPPYTGREIPL
jgi:hypothetical protein